MKISRLLSAIAVLTLCASQTFAADKTPKSKRPYKAENGKKAHNTLQDESFVHTQKYAIGFQSTWPTWGLSGQMDINNKLTGQAVLGFLGDANIYSLRGLYSFQKSSAPFEHNFYGFASIGDYTQSTIDDNGNSTRESVIGFGFGAGLEAAPFEDMPLWLNFEIGASFASFQDNSNFNTFGFGIGAHYRF